MWVGGPHRQQGVRGGWCMSSTGDEMVEEGCSRKEKGKGGNVGS